MTPVTIHRGNSPVVLAFPHSGLFIPNDIFDRLTPLGQTLADTDWHVDRLYDGLLPEATLVKANFHRYVIDPNRDQSGASLYPGQNTTGLVPLTDFNGKALWSVPPNEVDIEARRYSWHTPYHAALGAELQRIKESDGVAILYDCHSIRSRVTYLFEGILPDFNIGTNNGTTCDPIIERVVADACSQAERYSTIVNGRFRGGWTTRHYGQPDVGIHAIQMELAQSTYLASEVAPFDLDIERAARVQVHLGAVLRALESAASQLKGKS